MALFVDAVGPDGRVARTALPAGRTRIAAQPGFTYRVVDDAGRLPASTGVKRLGNDLLIDGLPDDRIVELGNFFSACTPAQSCQLAMETIAGSGAAAITPASEPVAALADGTFAFHVPADLAGSVPPPPETDTTGGSNFRPIMVGIGAAALLGAAGGGGGGGGSSGGGGAPPSGVTLTSPKLMNDSTPVLAGTVDPNSRVTVTIQTATGPVTFQALADESGNWSIDTGTARAVSGTWSATGLPDGTYNLLLLPTSPTGAAGQAVGATITIDATAPAAPTIATIATDNIVNAAEAAAGVTVSGTAEAGTSVQVLVGTTTHAAAVDANGAWSAVFARTELPVDGAVTVTATALDAAGNASPAATRAIALDTLPPASPTVTSPGVTNQIRPTVGGFAEPNTTVTLALDLDRNGTADVTYVAPVSSSGVWSVVLGTTAPVSGSFPAGGLANGSVTNLRVTATDAAGNVSGPALPTLTVDTSIPAAPTIATVAGDNIVNAVEASAAGGVTVSGTLSQAARPVTVTWNDGAGGHVLTHVVTASGTSWATTFTAGELATLVDGSGSITATYVGVSGATSAQGVQTTLIDRVAPAAPVITDNVPGATASGPVTFTFTFAEPVTGFTASDVAVTGGTAGALTGSGTTYSMVVTPTPDVAGTVSVSVAAGTVTDVAGNPSVGTASGSQAYNTVVPPTLTITDNVPGATATGPVTFTFTFTEAVTGFTASDVVVTGGTAGPLTGSGATYTMVVTPTPDTTGTLTVSVGPGTVTDLAGNPNTGTATDSQAFNTATPPTLTITDDVPGATASGPVTFTFTFSEAVTGFTAADVVVSGGTAGPLTGSGASYSMVVTPPADSTGTIAVSVGPGTVTDLAGNPNTGTATDSQAFNTAVPPTLTITDDTAAATAIGPVTFNFAWSEAVSGFAAGDVTVSGGTAGPLTGSGASYSMVVTPTAGTNGTINVSVAPGAVTDLQGNPNTAGASGSQAYDTAAPGVTVGDTTPAATATGPVTFTFAFTEPVTGFTAGDVSVSGGTAGALSGSGASYTMLVTPAANTHSTLFVTVPAASAIDAAGNGNSVSNTGSQAYDTRTVSLVDLLDDFVPGVSPPAVASGSTRNDPTPTLEGTVSGALLGGESITIERNGVAVGTATMDTATTFHYDEAVPLSSGTYTYTAHVSAAGYAGPDSGTFTYTYNPLSLV